MRLTIPVLLAAFWTAACVVIKFDTPTPPPPSKDWSFTPLPEIDPGGCCIENEDEPDLKKGPHSITFADWLNPLVGWNIDHYALMNQWGDVVVKIPPKKSGIYYVTGLPPGCYTLRAIGRGLTRNVPSVPTPEVCTPGLTSGRIWT